MILKVNDVISNIILFLVMTRTRPNTIVIFQQTMHFKLTSEVITLKKKLNCQLIVI